MAILFIYAVISFIFLDDSVHNRDMSMFCENLGQCFVTVLRLGLIEGLGSVSAYHLILLCVWNQCMNLCNKLKCNQLNW